MKKDKKQRVNADNASHNLDAQIDGQHSKPSRDVADADFAAEAHGFTAFENTGQGSSYRGGALDHASDNDDRNESDDAGDDADEGKDDDRVPAADWRLQSRGSDY